MKLTRVLAVLAVLLALSGNASADLVDPDMAMDAGSFSIALTKFTSFTPINGGGVLDLFNDTGQLLTSFGLTTFIKTGLTDAQLSAFVCRTVSDPFFLNCGFSYDQSTGQLTTTFFGVNPADGDETTDSEIGQREGIPTLAAGCTDENADSAGCTGQGHFSISLNYDFSFGSDPAGGWSPEASPDLFDKTPTFGLSTAQPEPSAMLPLGLAVIGLVGFAVSKHRRQARRNASGIV